MTEEERAVIRATTLEKHNLIEHEDEMEEKAIEAEQEKGFQVDRCIYYISVLDHIS